MTVRREIVTLQAPERYQPAGFCISRRRNCYLSHERKHHERNVSRETNGAAMSRPRVDYWNEARLAQLRTLLAAGESAGSIAAVIKDHAGVPLFSRNAIIGKVHRTPGLQLLGTKSAPGSVNPPKPRKPRPPRPRAVRQKPNAPALVAGKAADAPAGLPVPVRAFRSIPCRFPLGERPYHDCGKPSVDVGPGGYCESHARLCYEPVKKRERAERRQLHGIWS